MLSNWNCISSASNKLQSPPRLKGRGDAIPPLSAEQLTLLIFHIWSTSEEFFSALLPHPQPSMNYFHELSEDKQERLGQQVKKSLFLGLLVILICHDSPHLTIKSSQKVWLKSSQWCACQAPSSVVAPLGMKRVMGSFSLTKSLSVSEIQFIYIKLYPSL